MPTNTTTAPALNRRALLSRALTGAAGAAIGATAAVTVANAAAASGADTELFALLDEEERLWTMVSRFQDEAQRRKEAIRVGRVEFGQRIMNGQAEPVYSTNEHDLLSWFNSRTLSPAEDLKIREYLNPLQVRYVVYHDRRDELLAKMRSEADARVAALRAAGVDELNAKAESYIAQASVLSERIDKIRPATIGGAIRLLDVDIGDRTDNAVAGLREIAKRESLA